MSVEFPPKRTDIEAMFGPLSKWRFVFRYGFQEPLPEYSRDMWRHSVLGHRFAIQYCPPEQNRCLVFYEVYGEDPYVIAVSNMEQLRREIERVRSLTVIADIQSA